jgi:tetratricopeptide (TPR) repeat protein
MRDKWLAAISAHVERIERAWDSAAVLDVAVLGVAGQLAGSLGDDTADLPAWHLLGRFHWYRDSEIFHAGEGGWEADNEAMATAFARCLLAGMDIPRDVLGPVMRQAAVLSAEPDSARLWQRLASSQPPGRPLRALLLAALAEELARRFAGTGDAATLEAAIDVGQEATEEAADNDPVLPAMHFQVGALLASRFGRSARRGDIDGAVANLRRALDLSGEDSPERARYLSVYGGCLRARFDSSGDPADLDAAASACEEAVGAADDAAQPACLPALADVLIRRFDVHGHAADLEAAVDAFRQAAGALPAGSFTRATCLSGLGVALRARYGLTRRPDDLNEAIITARQCVAESPAAHPDLGNFLGNLASSLMIRATLVNTPEDLEEAVAMGRLAVESAPAGHPFRGALLTNLSGALRTRHEQQPGGGDLAEAIALAREAVQITPSDDVHRSRYLLNLCATQQARFDETRDPADADEAVETGRQMLAAVPPGHSNRANALLTLGAALRQRSELPGHGPDLDEAVTVMRQALSALPPGPARTESSSSLAATLRQRFERAGDQMDLDGAIGIFRAVAEDSDGGAADGGSAFYQLGATLLIRHERQDDPDDLTDAVTALRHALAAPTTDPGDPSLYRYRFSQALRLRFTRTGEHADITTAVAMAREAVEMAVPGDPRLPDYRLGLGKALNLQAQLSSVPRINPQKATRSELVAFLAALADIDSEEALPDVLAPGAADAAAELAVLIAKDERRDLGASSVLGRFFWLRSLALPEGASDDGPGDTKSAAAEAAISAYLPVFQAGRHVPAGLMAAVARAAANQAIDELTERTPEADCRPPADDVTLWRRIVDALPGDYPGHGICRGFLGVALYELYSVTGDPADLDEGLIALQAAIPGVPGDYGLLPSFRMLLSQALGVAALTSGGSGLLDRAIEAAHQAVRDAAGEEQAHSGALLGWTYLIRYQVAGDGEDLAAGVALLAEAIKALPEGEATLWLYLTHLSDARLQQFSATGDPALLEEAVNAGRHAVDRSPGDDPAQAACLIALGAALQARALHTGNSDDLDASIALLSRCTERIATGHPARTASGMLLGEGLTHRYLRSGSHEDLDGAIEYLQHALAALSPGSALRSRGASALGHALMARFHRVGGQADLDAAIAISREAARSVATGHHDRARYLSDYAAALQLKYARTTDPRYIDEAIEVARQAVGAASAHPVHAAAYQMVLSAALRARCAIKVGQAPPGEIEDAGGTGASVVGAGILPGTGNDAESRIAADLAEAVALMQQAAAASPPGHLLSPIILGELGATHLVRFAFLQLPDDLGAAVTALRQAVAATEGQPSQAEHLHRLAVTLETASTQPGQPDHRAEAIALYRRAAQSSLATPTIRIRAARGGAEFAADFAPTLAADLLQEAVRLLPEAVSRQLNRADQQHALGEFVFLASEAAEQVLATGGPTAAARALALLEQGRAVLHGQALDIRRDLLDLQAAHPELAARFTRLRDQLHAADGPNDGSAQASALDSVAIMTKAASLADASLSGTGGANHAEDRYRAGAEFASLLTQIRGLAGFESFLLPPQSDELTQHASGGPIVTFNVGRSRSHALIVTTEEITALPLPGLTATDLLPRVTTWEESLDSIRHHPRDERARLDAENKMSRVLEWLWDSAAEPVLRHLGHLKPPEPGQPWPRVWWAPGGLLGSLPVHAAGYHRLLGAETTVLDKVVSSYTPTIRALAYARYRARTTPPTRALVVGMPTTPGRGSLPNVARELDALSQLLPSPTVLTESPDGIGAAQAPTRHTVASHLPDFGVVHFACHAASDPADPSRSQIFLHDWAENPFTVATLIPARLRHAQLAFLSACKTAHSGSLDLLDEGIHLTSAFQLAGFPHVIGTLWPIYDDIAVEVATTFYTQLQSGPRTLDVSASAQALHDAIRKVRAVPGGHFFPSVWAAYIHAGS